MRKDILIRDRIVQCWVLVPFFKERKHPIREKEKKDNSYQRQNPERETKSFLAFCNCH